MNYSLDCHDFSSGIKDGAHSLFFSNGKVDFMSSGLLNVKPGESVLVKFSGAVTDRSKKKAPFFFGLGIAGQLGYPIISFSDPALELNDKINIGWYAGYQGFEDLPQKLSVFLDQLSDKLGVNLIVFGGSGGGFATIAVTSFMKSSVSAVVWNPQTSISKYVKMFVDRYIAAAFPHSREEGDTIKNYEILQGSGITHVLKAICVPENVKLVYMQNLTDRHLDKHCKPFFEGFKLDKVEGLPFFYSEKLLACVGDWGVRHVAPPKSLIKKVLSYVDESDGVPDLIERMKFDEHVISYFPDGAVALQG